MQKKSAIAPRKIDCKVDVLQKCQKRRSCSKKFRNGSATDIALKVRFRYCTHRFLFSFLFYTFHCTFIELICDPDLSISELIKFH